MNGGRSQIDITMMFLVRVVIMCVAMRGTRRGVDNVDLIGIHISGRVIGGVVVVDRAGQGSGEFGRGLNVVISVAVAMAMAPGRTSRMTVVMAVARVRVPVVLKLVAEATVRVQNEKHDYVEHDAA